MLPLTLNQAAKAARKSKAALLEAIRSGRLSAARNALQQWQIDPAELFRVYPQNQFATVRENRDQPPQENYSNPLVSERLAYTEEKLKALEAERERERLQLESQLDDLKADRDHWREQAERMTLLLTHQPPARFSFWQRLTGKG